MATIEGSAAHAARPVSLRGELGEAAQEVGAPGAVRPAEVEQDGGGDHRAAGGERRPRRSRRRPRGRCRWRSSRLLAVGSVGRSLSTPSTLRDVTPHDVKVTVIRVTQTPVLGRAGAADGSNILPRLCSRRSWSRTGARSRSGSCGRSRRWASPRSASTRRPTARRPTCARPTRRSCSAHRVPAESYLKIEKILEVAEQAGAEAIHPGYGFLAENAAFAAACEKAGRRLHRPARERDRGDGLEDARPRDHEGGRGADRARRDRALARRRGGDARPPRRSATRSPARRPAAVAARASASPAAEDELEEAFEGAAREGEKFFSDDRVYLERYLEDPRHVEVQVLADSHGNVIHLGERDCSIQRRHQKLIEEAPGPHVDAEMRERIGKIATDAAEAVDYRSAGHGRGAAGRRRVLLPRDEHPGPGRALRHRDGHRDRHRPRADAGSPPARSSRSPRTRSSCAATRSSAGSTPRPRTRTSPRRPGGSTSTSSPAGPGVRVDSGVEAGSEVTPLYDPMVAKLIVWDTDRERATARMLRALGEYEIEPLHDADPVPHARSSPPSSGPTARPAAT